MTSGWQAPSSHALPDDRATEADGLVADARVMASRRSRPRRLLLPTILAAVLAAEVTGLALARTISAPAPDAPAAAVAVTAPLAPTRPAVDLDRSATARRSGDRRQTTATSRRCHPPSSGPRRVARTSTTGRSRRRATCASHGSPPARRRPEPRAPRWPDFAGRTASGSRRSGSTRASSPSRAPATDHRMRACIAGAARAGTTCTCCATPGAPSSRSTTPTSAAG